MRWLRCSAPFAVVVASFASAQDAQTVTGVASAISGKAPLSVKFSAKELIPLPEGAQDYRWSFDDGTSAIGRTAVHVFREPRVYRVTLVAAARTGRQETHELLVSVHADCCTRQSQLAAAVSDVVVIDNGTTNTISDSRFDSSSVWVRDAANGSVTTLNVLTGAEIGTRGSFTGPGLLALEHSQVNVFGGSVGSAILARDQSSVHVSGGSHPGEIGAQGNSRVEMSGGVVVSDVPSFLTNSATLAFSGGNLTGGLSMENSTFARISGGSLDFLNVGGGGDSAEAASFRMTEGAIGPRFADAIQFNGFGSGRIEGGTIRGDLAVGNCCEPNTRPRLSLKGGVLQGTLDVGQAVVRWSGGAIEASGDEEILARAGTLLVIGRDFNLPYGPVASAIGTIRGLLSDGTPMEARFQRTQPDAEVVLVFPARIDIKPGSDLNSINVRGRAVVSVAILGSEEFDAADVALRTLVFGPKGARARDRSSHLEDVNLDGFLDLVCHFRASEAGIAAADDEACLDGELADGTPFDGCDSVHTIAPSKRR